ncbi:hypothetical protein E2562_034796 [Oryza meyeriana var. granulata]|uniref:F-box domain-containing protein n=1 Tax=Oryza meyeriana var. granulata TaxID=110450 RepID=A0A6G1E6H2_9ORYZ|nr:hypothetical protein E2562_034796 [Oryza meyeriana var. granulata]
MATVTGQRRTNKRKTSAEPAAACGGVVTLPEHGIAEVLLRLPARGLARLRCACRSWNAEISSRGFQDRHHALAAAKFAFLQPSYATARRLHAAKNRTK